MKLYFFQSGVLRSYQYLFDPNAGDAEICVPVPFYLIQHQGKNILFDTGQHKDDTKDHLVARLRQFAKPEFTMEDGWAPNAIRKIGLTPEDIDIVILSHLHHDHAGAVGEFPNATYIVQKEEYDYVRRPDTFMSASYLNDEVPAPVNGYDMKGTDANELTTNVDWFFLNGREDDRFDLFRDGKIVIYFTPGHTVGHQSLLVRTDEDGDFFLTADATYTMDAVRTGNLPGIVVKPQDYVQSVKLIRLFEKTGAKIVPGHDVDVWASLKHAPEFYH